ncbi:MAG: S-ribosylhomocysteine lyase [Clostridiales bacterium]|nr:S-ribosylhomocysteine lyase [Clostridiales bacterium]
MNKIESFKVDHTKLKEGIYISRIDGDITTYDLRFKKPNMGDYLSNNAMHTIEHLMATYLRNSDIADDVIYFGPMGCQTGFYLLIRNADNARVLESVKNALKSSIGHKGEVFGCSEIECGNYRSLDLKSAVDECEKYLAVLDSRNNNFNY